MREKSNTHFPQNQCSDYQNPKDKYLDTNGLKLHYIDWGNNEQHPMVLLHGFLSHAHTWDNFAERFRTNFRIIALDQRGHGESQWSRHVSYTIDDHYSDIYNIINILNLIKPILIGHSMGGRNAILYTACTNNVERLVLVDARPGSNTEGSIALQELVENLPHVADSIDEIVFIVRTIYPYLSEESCCDIVKHGFVQRPDKKYIPMYDTRMMQQSKGAGYIAEDLRPFLHNISCPTLILRGEESSFLTRKEADEMCRIIPKADWMEIPKSTHMPMQENPEAFIRLVSNFLKITI